MFRSAAAAVVSTLGLVCVSAQAGNVYSDQFPDPLFAATNSPLNWIRLFTPGFNDEKGVGMARMPDGSLVVAYSAPGGVVGKQVALRRFGANGAAYSGTFGNNGLVLKDGYLVDVTAMTVDSQGRIIVVGTTPGPGGMKDFGVLRFNADGSDDTSFGGDGGVAVGFEPVVSAADDAPLAVFEQVLENGSRRIVVTGNTSYTSLGNAFHSFLVIGLSENGNYDPDFGNFVDPNYGGRFSDRFVSGQQAYAGAVLKLANNAFVIAGTTVISGTDTDFAACYVAAVGVPFTDGCRVVPIDEPGPGGSLYDGATAIAYAGNNTFVLAGNASGKVAAVRLMRDGTGLALDPGFSGSGPRPNVFISSTANVWANDVVVRGNGSIFIAGRANPAGIQYGALFRLNRNGTPDTGPLFSPTGLANLRAPTLSGNASYYTEFNKVLLDAGKPLLLGSSVDSTSAATDFDGILTRLQSDLIFASGLQ